ncbi:hypothetical protein [Pelagerythrobacter aerophilus]|uniref:hypothetical protein n=1 Tax=Pelagerythrobacter aerophilus TaxID=2306995 RepID=UPI0015FF4E45|nr:hypothetical protein [Pelagerythrobacter aerophilus]
MVSIRDGVSASRKGRSRPILTLGKGSNGSRKSAQLGGVEHEQSSETRSETQRFEDALWAARNSWDIARRSLPNDAEGWLHGGGFAGRGKLSRRDAERLLREAFAALNRSAERKRNALAAIDGGAHDGA